jgi:hypothetical protein
MSRRFEIGPILVAVGAVVLIVSLFLDWYGSLTAWQAFEVVEVLLGSLGVAALVIAVGQLIPDLEYIERRRLPVVVLAVAVLVAAEIIDPPPAAGDQAPASGAWIAFAAAIVMLAGAVLTASRVRFAVSVEGREQRRERVAVVDNRQDTTETAAISPDGESTTPKRRKAGPASE